jgi:nitrogen regulatory protein P-II 1
MKLVIAYIQPHRLQDVKRALFSREIYRMSVTNAVGCGEQHGYQESYRGIQFEVDLLKKVRVEIAVNEDYVERAINAIVEGARIGQIGDGKIFVTNLAECVRIRTGERGPMAIG